MQEKIEIILSRECNRLYDSWLRKAKGICKDDTKGQDLLHTTLASILTSEKNRAVATMCAERNSLDRYVCRALWIQYHSKNSTYYLHYKKDIIHYDGPEPDHPDQTWLGNRLDTETLDSLTSRLKPFDAELLRLYSMPDFDYRETAEAVGVNVTVLYKSIQRSINTLSNVISRRERKGQTP